MTSLFQVSILNDYGDSQSYENPFNSLEKEKVIDAARTIFKEALIEYTPSERPNILTLMSAFKNVQLKHGLYGYQHIEVIETPLNETVKIENTKSVWTPTIVECNEVFESILKDLFMFDLNTTPTEAEHLKLRELFIKNAELFREKNYYGVTKHAADLINLLQ